MYLDPADAQRFSHGYKLLMLEVLGEQADRITGSVVPLLAKARAKLARKPALLRKSIARLEARNVKLDRDVVTWPSKGSRYDSGSTFATRHVIPS